MVFLDEFEKTSPDVHTSLLKVMDNGELFGAISKPDILGDSVLIDFRTGSYRDRRQGRDHGELDCNKSHLDLGHQLGRRTNPEVSYLKAGPA